jgi:hypothetical protein
VERLLNLGSKTAPDARDTNEGRISVTGRGDVMYGIRVSRRESSERKGHEWNGGWGKGSMKERMR